MQNIEQLLNDYLVKNGITISHVAKAAELDYELLRRSLRESRRMTANELASILTSTNISLNSLTAGCTEK